MSSIETSVRNRKDVTDQLTPEVIRLAYRLILGREPENEEIVTRTIGYGTLERLRDAFLTSDEFKSRMGVYSSLGTVPLDCPPIEVELCMDRIAAATLVAHIQQIWTRLGHEQPHWSVLSTDQFRSDRIAENEDAFYSSGASDSALLLAILGRHGFAPEQLPRVLEYGCGIGRVTAHLARVFNSVIACDISHTHLRQAERIIHEMVATNVTFRLAGLPDFGMNDTFDLWFSRIVLQHNPPPIIAMILQRALTCLAPGGVAVFQVPTYAIDYRFELDVYLEGTGQSKGIEMHVLSQRTIFEIMRETGCVPLEVREDESSGHSNTWLSNIFVLQKLL